MIFEGAAAALALAPIAFAGGFIQGLTGFGSALVTIPLATFFVPLPFALAVFAIVDFANGMRLGLENPRNAVLGDIARMVPLMIAGIAAAAVIHTPSCMSSPVTANATSRSPMLKIVVRVMVARNCSLVSGR